MNPIQMVNPAAEYRLMQEELDAAVLGVLRSGRYILGPEGEALEKELAEYLGASVPELQPTACAAPRYAASSFSSASPSGPRM